MAVVVVGAGLLFALATWVEPTPATRHGVIVLEGLPANAVVEVDGHVVAVDRNGPDPEVALDRGGSHKLTVRHEKQEIYSNDVTVGGEPARIRIEKPVAAAPARAPQKPPLDTPKPARVPSAPVLSQPAAPPLKRPAPVNRLATVAPNGRWRIEGDELIQDTRARATGILFGDPDWEDYDFTAEAMRTDGNEDLSVIFRAENWVTSYWCGFGTYGNRWYEVSSAEQIAPNKRRIVPAVAGSIKSGEWYTIAVKLRGARCEVFLDGKCVFDFRDDRYLRGRVGFRSFATAVRFRNIKITAPDGKVLWEGLPELPN